MSHEIYETSEHMSTVEVEQANTVVEIIAPDGLGFGEGGISVKDQIKQGILTEEAVYHIHEHLTTNPLAFKAVEADDDGCGDGRPWSKIIQFINKLGATKIKLYKTSLLRAKVFGGGLVAASN